MPLKLSNNASSILATTITTASLQITVQDASKFPAGLVAGDWFPVTVVDAALRVEIMRAVSRTGNTIFLDTAAGKGRGQEGTVAYAFAAGARVDVRMTAGALVDATSNADNLMTGTIKDSLLPARIAPTALYVTNCDLATQFGRFRTDASTTNAPTTNPGYLWNDVWDGNYAYQEFQDTLTNKRWARRKAGTWSVWYPLLLTETVPIGTIVDFAGKCSPEAPAKLPAGWLVCDGFTYVVGTPYDLLYAIIGNQYGGTAGTNFRVPDLRGRVVAGKDNMGASGQSADRMTGQYSGLNGDLTIGTAGGAEHHKLTEAQMPAHWHLPGTLKATMAGEHTHTYSRLSGAGAATNFGSGNGIITSNTGPGGDHEHAITGVMGPAGSDGTHTNMQPTMILNKIIKYRDF